MLRNLRKPECIQYEQGKIKDIQETEAIMDAQAYETFLTELED